MLKRVLILSLMVLLPVLAFSATTGKIIGTVVDKETGPEAATGRLVFRSGTPLRGRYVTINLAPRGWLMVSEIRILANGRNLARGREYSFRPSPTSSKTSRYPDDGAKLTDGWVVGGVPVVIEDLLLLLSGGSGPQPQDWVYNAQTNKWSKTGSGYYFSHRIGHYGGGVVYNRDGKRLYALVAVRSDRQVTTPEEIPYQYPICICWPRTTLAATR